MRYKIFVVVLFVTFSTYSQNNSLKKSALRDAKIAAEATLNSDFDLLLKHTYPPIIEVMGGKENALSIIKAAMKGMKEQGMVFEKAEVVSVSDIVNDDGEYRCYVEGNNQIKMPGMRIKSKSYLLGIYNEEQKFWYFLEAEKLKNKALADKVLPNFKTELVIPPDTMETETID
ncbi:MAG: hypothetical protein QNJ57_12610 [Flavobacteriaceae bacterium]|nr:hypothetical protein [Flavobacteriaceae bacterium]